jgi:hypothetical protein
MSDFVKIVLACIAFALALWIVFATWNDRIFKYSYARRPEWRRWPREIDKLIGVLAAIFLCTAGTMLLMSAFSR